MLAKKIKNTIKKKKVKPRLPLDAVLKLHSLPLSTKKGGKGYDRKRMKKEAVQTIEENI